MKTKIATLFCLIFATAAWAKPLPTELFLRGYSVIPTPRNVKLQEDDIQLDGSWAYRAEKVAQDHIAIRTLVRGLKEFHAIELKPVSAQAKNVIRLSLVKGAVRTGADPEIDKQGYLLALNFPK